MTDRHSSLGKARSWLQQSRANRAADPLAIALPEPWLAVSERGGSGRLVVGPGGAFLVRSAMGPVSDTSPRVRDAITAANAIATRLTAATGTPTVVHPVLVVQEDVQTTSQPRNATVVASKLLRPWLVRHPSILSAAEVSRLVRAARSATLSVDPAGTAGTAR
jgi:hypothetical protein